MREKDQTQLDHRGEVSIADPRKGEGGIEKNGRQDPPSQKTETGELPTEENIMKKSPRIPEGEMTIRAKQVPERKRRRRLYVKNIPRAGRKSTNNLCHLEYNRGINHNLLE